MGEDGFRQTLIFREPAGTAHVSKAPALYRYHSGFLVSVFLDFLGTVLNARGHQLSSSPLQYRCVDNLRDVLIRETETNDAGDAESDGIVLVRQALAHFF